MWGRWLVIVMAVLGLVACSDDAEGSGDADAGTAGSSGASGTGGSGGGGTGGSGGTGGVPDPGGDRTAGDTKIEFAIADGESFCQEVPCPKPFTFMEVSPIGGSPLALAFPTCGTVVCDTCQESVCPNSCDDEGDGGFSLEPAEPESLNWDGGYWVAGTCDGATACVRHTFAAPGQYRARWCALETSDASCGSAGAEVCTQVDFDYPSETVFTATLGD